AAGHAPLAAAPAAPALAPAVARRIEAARDYLAAARRVVLPVADVPLPHLSLALPSTAANPKLARRLAAEHRLDGAVARVEAAVAALRIQEGETGARTDGGGSRG